MTFLRAAARTLLAGYFVVNGAKALKDPEAYAAEQERFASTVVPLAKKVAPEDVSAQIPEDTTKLARIAGALQVAGGLGMIFGKGRRFGASLIAASMVPQLMGANPLGQGGTPAEREASRNDLLKDLALLGGALIASADTEGKPSLAWRAEQQRQLLAKQAAETKTDLSKTATQTSKKMQKEAARVQKRLAQEAAKARKQAEKVSKKAAKQAKELTA